LLGIVEKMDTVWINGHQVGASAWVENPRAYPVRAGTLHPGKNQITIRVLKTAADGGFRSPPESLRLQVGGLAVPLEEGWRVALGADARPPHPLPLGYENWPTMPTVLYEGMIHPLAPMALTGVLWYQGEQNSSHARQYRTLLPAMIADWRVLFHQPDLPFYIASLPAFMKRNDQPGPAGWAELREAQQLTARTVPHTGVAITIDTGDPDNIHPTEKLPVGERLALLALRDVYGKDVVNSGPVFARAENMPGGLRLIFTHTEGGLVTKGVALGEFSVAGADRVWHWAQAKLDGDTVIVSAAAVPAPVAVRYAWQSNPLATLFNGAGLPAAPFRTDDWTDEKKP
jgi:sialate O-acetylesterase